jgi:hypothetical protein
MTSNYSKIFWWLFFYLYVGSSVCSATDGANASQANCAEIKSAATSSLWSAATFACHGVRGFDQSGGDQSRSSMSDMAATGANVLRIFVDLKLDPGAESYTIDLSHADGVISDGTEFGFKVVIAFEPVTTHSSPEFWANNQLRSSITANWIAVAKKYRGNTTVAGYDLINEPIAPKGQAQWITFATQLIKSIKSADPDHVIIFEPSPGGLPEALSSISALLPFDNIVYSIHDYEPHMITHQGILHFTSMAYPSPASSPIGQVDKATLSRLLAPVRQFTATFHAPIYIGEFSCVRWAPDSSAYNYVSDQISLFEAEGYSWSYHSWREYQGWDAELPSSYFAQFPYLNAKPQGWINLNQAPYRSGNTDTMSLLKRYFKLNLHLATHKKD